MSLVSLYTILWHDSSVLECLTFTSQINSLQNINCWTLDSGNLIYNIYHPTKLVLGMLSTCFKYNINIDMVWIPGSENDKADFFSCIVDYDDWSISEYIRSVIPKLYLWLLPGM
jgi:hypothetical protein